jgi:peptide/nickel transport system permease protein
MSDLEARLPEGPPQPPGQLDAEAITTEGRSQFATVARRFVRHRLAMISLGVFVLICAFAFIGPMLWPYDHTIQRGIPTNISPTWEHPFGTTSAGNDVFGQVMRGTQQSLKVALTTTALASTIGAIWGAVAGYLGGRVDELMMRIVDIILVVPLLVLVAAVAGNTAGGTTWREVAIILGLFGWTTIARVVRSVVLSLREQEFIEAAHAMGASGTRIVFTHLLPNAAGVIIVAATLLVATTILAEAGLSFLNLGIQPPDTSLGLLIENARSAPFTRPWLFYPPGIFIIAIALTVNFIGDGMRDALDPRQTMVRR